MKCPHCGKDIAERLIISEAAKIHRRKAVKTLSAEEASSMAKKRWETKKERGHEDE